MSDATRIQILKELRDLLPWWAATVGAVLACAALGRVDMPRWLFTEQFWVVGLFIYIAGAVALGALSIGHEYSYRTLTGLLAQPVSRSTLLLQKVGVALILIGSLGVIAFWTVGSNAAFSRPAVTRVLFWLPLPVGLFLAPWLTMLCRSALAGSVFAIGAPALLLAISRAVHGTPDEMFAWTAMWQGTLVLTAVGAVNTWLTFLRLEAFDGPHTDINLPAWLRQQTIGDVPATRTHNRAWLLLKKELRFHQMTFVVSASYLSIWIGVVVLRRTVAGFLGPDLTGITIIHACLVALIAGALPSAEERQLGTAESQLLLPLAGWKQWALKAGCALSLTALLAFGLPALLAAISPSTESITFAKPQSVLFMLLCCAALFVSSLSTSGMRAILASFPVVTGTFLLVMAVLTPLLRAVSRLLMPVARTLEPMLNAGYSPRFIDTQLLWLMAGLGLLLLRLGYTNHRSAERGVARIRRHAAWIGAYFLAALVVVSFLSALDVAAYMVRH